MLSKLFQWRPARPREATENPSTSDAIANPGVRIVDGLIRPNYGCQSEIVSHCNLACLDCNHLSALAQKGFTDPDTLYRDYAMLAKVYRPQVVYLTGGEPLLHPDIVGAIQAVRASGITERIRILTNGLRLHRMDDAFWSAIDDLEVSLYPDSKIEPAQVATWMAKAAERDVLLEVYHFTEFRRSFSTTRNPDDALVKRLYDGCKAAHVWGCHYVHAGFMYRCPQSVFLPRMLDLPASEHTRDGIALSDAPAFRDALLRFLTAPEPLQGCWNCLANTGVRRPHQQVRRPDWRAGQDGAIETLVDYDELARIEAQMHIQRRDMIKDLVAYAGS